MWEPPFEVQIHNLHVYMLVFMQMQNTWLGESNDFVHLVSREQIIIGGGLLWVLFITLGRKSVTGRECHAHFINTILHFWREKGKPIADSHAPTQHTEPKAKHQQSTSKWVNTNKNPCTHMNTRKYKHGDKKSLMSLACLCWHLLGDTLLFAGQGCSATATEDKDSLHVVFTQP